MQCAFSSAVHGFDGPQHDKKRVNCNVRWQRAYAHHLRDWCRIFLFSFSFVPKKPKWNFKLFTRMIPFFVVSAEQDKKNWHKRSKKGDDVSEWFSWKIDVRHVIGERLSSFILFFFSSFTRRRRVSVHSAPFVSLIQFRSDSRDRRNICTRTHTAHRTQKLRKGKWKWKWEKRFAFFLLCSCGFAFRPKDV